jgi:hypothetical protein
VFFNRLGEMHRSFENQRYRASGLNLVTAAIVLRNTVYLERPIQVIKERGQPVDENLLQHVSPLAWEHINLTGDYVWQADPESRKGETQAASPVSTGLAYFTFRFVRRCLARPFANYSFHDHIGVDGRQENGTKLYKFSNLRFPNALAARNSFQIF